MFGKKHSDMVEYVVEYCTENPICGLQLFRNNPKRDSRGKYYAIEDYIYTGGRVFMMDGECILFVSDVPNPHTFVAATIKEATKKFRKYVKRVKSVNEHALKHCV